MMIYPPTRQAVNEKSRQIGFLKVAIDNLERATTNVRIHLRPMVEKDDQELKVLVVALAANLAKLWYHFNSLVNEAEDEVEDIEKQ